MLRPISILLAPLCLSACAAGEGGDASAEPGGEGEAGTASRLTGLYEGDGNAEARDRLCLIRSGTGPATFGLVTLGEGRSACSGTGEAVREGEAMLMVMAGDGDCAIRSRFEDGTILLPTELPEGCDYYCGPGASLAGATFERAGGGMEAARSARDLAGGQLCQ